MKLVDAHNHLQDARLHDYRSEIIAECKRLSVAYAVVNGTRPSDWPLVTALAESHLWILPSYGVHPWYVEDLPSSWADDLESALQTKGAVIGEVGIDHWKEGIDRDLQEEVFLKQMRLARKLELPVTIHGLRAWERLLELLRAHGVPARGFLLHSYSGPAHLIRPFAELGAYFSCAPAFLESSRSKKFGVFKEVPIERLLPETDAPDQCPPVELEQNRLQGVDGARLNHPTSIVAVYDGLSQLLAVPPRELGERLFDNFQRLFRPLT